MKRIKRFLITLLLVSVSLININAACINSDGSGKKGSVSLSASSISVNVGKTTTFKVNAPCAAGKISVASSDTSIATVTPNTEFVDDSSFTVTVKGKSAGKTTIIVTLSDVADYASNTLSGTKKVTVTVKTPTTTTKKQTTTTVKKSTTPTTTTTTKPTTKVVKEIKVNKFEIVGYNINFDQNTKEYTIDVDNNVDKLYIIVSGENFSSVGDKEVDIAGKDQVVVTLKNEDKQENYTIKLNRTSSASVSPEIKEIVKEVEVVNNTYLYTTIGLLVVCIILTVLLLKNKKAKSIEPKNTVVSESTISPLQTTHIAPDNNVSSLAPSAPTVQNTQTTTSNSLETIDL